MEDKEITCVDCKQPFTFTVSEQNYYQSKGFAAPKRCLEDRRKKRPHFLDIPQEQPVTVGASTEEDENEPESY